MMLTILFAVLLFGAADAETLLEYKPIPEDSDDFLNHPYAVDRAPDGTLYLLDSKAARIHIWDKNGHYLRAFGKEGEGPGEIFFPSLIEANNQFIYIWDYRGRLTKFDREGAYVDSFYVSQYRPRDFRVLNENLILVAYRRTVDAKDTRATFQLLDGKGALVRVVKEFKDNSYVTPREDDNDSTTKIFAPDMAMHQEASGHVFFGFSEVASIFELDTEGNLVGKHDFQLKTDKPTDEEIDFVKNMEFPLITGNVMNIKELKDLKLNFNHEKAYYTHFTLVGSKAVFALTPMGGFAGCGNGYNMGQYSVMDRTTGKFLTAGRYRFPEGSVVYYKDGHLIATLLDKEGDFVLKLLKLKGM